MAVGDLLLDELRLRAGVTSAFEGIVEIELRAGIVLHQRRFALDVALLHVDALLGEIEHLAVDLDVGVQIVSIRSCASFSFASPAASEAERHRVDFEQQVAVLTMLAFLHRDLWILPETSGVISTFCAPT